MRYYSLKEFAQLVGVKPGTIARYHHDGLLPKADAVIGDVEGWKLSTIRKWDEKRRRKRGVSDPRLAA